MKAILYLTGETAHEQRGIYSRQGDKPQEEAHGLSKQRVLVAPTTIFQSKLFLQWAFYISRFWPQGGAERVGYDKS